MWPWLLDVEKLDVEQQRRVWRNHAARTACAIAHVGWNCQRALAADLHARNAFIPSTNHFAAAETERERLVAVSRAVELIAFVVALRAVVQPAGVMHRHLLSRLGLGTRTGLRILLQ